MAQSRAVRKARHAAYQETETRVLKLVIAEQRRQIGDLRKLVRMQRLLIERAE